MVSALPARSQANSPKAFKGYVPVPRSFFDHPIWRKSRVFSQQDAMLDLYRLARCLPTETLKRGEFQKSMAELATRWTWTQSRVKRFMAARVKDGTLHLVWAKDGEISVFALCEVRQLPKTPTNSTSEPARGQVAEALKAAPVVGSVKVAEPAPIAESDTSREKKERTKERKALEFRSEKNGESPYPSTLEQAAKPEPRPVSLSRVDEKQGTEKTTLTPEEHALAAKWFFGAVPREQWARRIPITKEQNRLLQSAMRNVLITCPREGSRLAREMARWS